MYALSERMYALSEIGAGKGGGRRGVGRAGRSGRWSRSCLSQVLHFDATAHAINVSASQLLFHAFAAGFLLSFEPLLDKYTMLLARGIKRSHGCALDMAVPLRGECAQHCVS